MKHDSCVFEPSPLSQPPAAMPVMSLALLQFFEVSEQISGAVPHWPPICLSQVQGAHSAAPAGPLL